jgi:hypothetical protein
LLYSLLLHLIQVVAQKSQSVLTHMQEHQFLVLLLLGQVHKAQELRLHHLELVV